MKKTFLIVGCMGMLALCSVAAVSQYKVIYYKPQKHTGDYLPSEKANPTYLDNSLLIEQDVNHTKMVDARDKSQTQDRTFYVNFAGERQRKNAEVSEKLLFHFYNWEWA